MPNKCTTNAQIRININTVKHQCHYTERGADRQKSFLNKINVWDAQLPVLLVLQQLAVSTSQSVTCLTEKLQWLLLVDGTEDRSLS